MQDNLIEQGLSLMLYGMGTVFVFLTLLVLATLTMSRVVNRLVPAAVSEQEPGNLVSASGVSAAPASAVTVTPQLRTAIERAIAQHRKST